LSVPAGWRFRQPSPLPDRPPLSPSQALSLWKRARRDRAVTLKAASLANQPCVSTPADPKAFLLDSGGTPPTGTARERYVGLTNHLSA
jgi:hypothetical protein